VKFHAHIKNAIINLILEIKSFPSSPPYTMHKYDASEKNPLFDNSSLKASAAYDAMIEIIILS
jgi:hypothetical protein